jgi:THAP domain-containing protein 4
MKVYAVHLINFLVTELEATIGILSEAIKPISWLIGRWRSESAIGSFPTIKEFEYEEDIEFSSFGQPLLNYRAYSFTPGPSANPIHFESGFLRIKPGTNSVAFMVAHNLGA